MSQTLTIVGASARAAAMSAARAGFSVCAGDLFADLDFRAACATPRVADYPRGLAAVIRGPQPGGWMYSGALENHPVFVNQMARIRPLLGNTAATLRRVRDPVLVADTLKGDGVACLEVARDASGITCDATWLCKPRRSAGGARISFWDERARAGGYPGGDFYFQRYADGLACSAVYVAARRESVLLGITRQIIGATWCGAGGFRYCGSVGPLELPDDVVVDIARLGDVLATRFDLVGLFGADLIVNPQGVWLVEVNPRYTASTELLDWAHNVSTVAWHVSACEAGRLPTRAPQDHRRLVAKCVLFATGRTVIQRDLRQRYDQPLSHGWPAIADVPAPGTAIEAGGPIVTIMAEGDNQEDVLAQLRGKAADVRDAVTA